MSGYHITQRGYHITQRAEQIGPTVHINYKAEITSEPNQTKHLICGRHLNAKSSELHCHGQLLQHYAFKHFYQNIKTL
jgi:hypothetical protein